MTDFEAMYYRLFNRVSGAINVLQQAQQEGEEKFIAGQQGRIIAMEREEQE